MSWKYIATIYSTLLILLSMAQGEPTDLEIERRGAWTVRATKGSTLTRTTDAESGKPCAAFHYVSA